MADEEVVTPEGEVCTVKDCCVLLCDAVVTPNPGRGTFTDRAVIDPAFDAVCRSVEKAYGFTQAEQVSMVLYALPIVYNAKLKRAIGRAKFVYDRGLPVAQVIELTGSTDIPSDYMHRLLIHEGCHVAHAVITQGRFSYEPAHGTRWQQLMIGAGVTAEARCSDPRLNEDERLRKGGPAVALTIADIKLGDTVSFIARTRKGMPPEKIVARVVQKTDKGAIVQNERGKWRVSYGILSKEPSP